jgi:hypothetical protein
VSWTEPTPIAARPLLAELIGYLEQDALPAAARARAEAVLLDLLEPIPMHPALELRTPVSDQARRVAVALRSAPADRRTLQEWGRDGRHEQPGPGVGLHSRNRRALRPLARARLHAALPALAEGAAVNRVAAHVGYESPSAFVAALRRETGQTPAAYFNAVPAALAIPSTSADPTE